MKINPEYTTKLGKLYKGDCLKILEAVEDESIDLIFADPPFNLDKDYGKGVNDNLKEEEYIEWSKKWIELSVKKLSNGGSFFLYNIPKWNIHLSEFLSRSLTFRHWITIKNTNSLPIRNRLYPAHYSLLYFIKGKKPKVFNPPRIPMDLCKNCGKELRDYGGYKNKLNPKGLTLSDIWLDIPVVRHKKYKKRSSNQLSLKLLDRILDIGADKDSVVLDPFGGSGTTYVAAELKGIKWLGIEISTTDAIIDRFKDIETEKLHFDSIQSKKNVLFTNASLKNREKNGISTSKYRLK